MPKFIVSETVLSEVTTQYAVEADSADHAKEVFEDANGMLDGSPPVLGVIRETLSVTVARAVLSGRRRA